MEAQSHRNAVGLVKVMGRQAGFIALISTLASCDVDACLIPEVPFHLDGDPGLLTYLRHRLAVKGHAVVVLAEGAGQHLLGSTEVRTQDSLSPPTRLHTLRRVLPRASVAARAPQVRRC